MPLSLPSPDRSGQAEWAWRKRLEGWTQERIADELGLHRSTVSRMLARFERKALKDLRRRVQATKARQTLQLEHIQDEAMRAWERSKLPVRKAKRKQAATTDGVVDLEEVAVEETLGDPRYLKVAIEAAADIRRIWGVDESTGDDAPDLAPPDEDPEAARRLELHRLDLMAAGLWAKASQGDIKAVGEMLRIMALRAKLLGVEPPAAAESEGALLEQFGERLAKGYGAKPDELPDATPVPGPDADAGG